MGSWWNSTELISNASLWARWAGALLAIAILVLGNRASVLQSRDRAAIQDETDLKVSNNERETEVAKSNAAAANAQAEEAKKTAESFRLDIATANERAAAAQEKAAQFNEIAERERLARIKLEDRLSPRIISPEGRQAMLIILKPFTGIKVDMLEVAGVVEVHNLSTAIKSVLSDAGMQPNGIWQSIGGSATHIVVLVRKGSPLEIIKAGNAILEALHSAGLHAAPWEDFESETPGAVIGPVWVAENAAPIRVVVGTKP